MIHSELEPKSIFKMNSNKTLLAGLVGGLAHFLLGWAVWGGLLASFFARNAGTATGVSKATPEMWAIALGSLALGFLLSYIYGRWAGITTFKTGAIAGLIIGLLMGAFYDLIAYGTTNLMNLTAVLADIVVSGIVTAIVGGIVGLALGWGKK